ncbi:MAG: hypothetical protein R2882_07430 [Gemmatimonadales bacterium]
MTSCQTNGAEHVLADTPDTPCRTVDQVRDAALTVARLVRASPTPEVPPASSAVISAFDEEFRHPFDQSPAIKLGRRLRQ